ncbi:PfkB family carbohydrate kinase [Synechococcus sp. CS-205]|uniref:PfkB family carbohydrate kinase n=1 Tax=Synechococcus sp. CS-205 TaxID=2847984 RepID=UPI00223AC8B3|nr:PfkB family carbohydrate kinase [Synechococcus sp. CS-205]MCT0249674.1 ribokinase [Synechococcus sp. CS-205]
MSVAFPSRSWSLPPLPPLRLAVVGHVEWVSFVTVEHLPLAGQIQHALETLEQPAGGGAVVAAQFSRLTDHPVAFFTALGRDALGEMAAAELRAMGLELHVAWREGPTRRAITFVEASGERTITVIGERLAPAASDPLPWSELAACDGVFVTAADVAALRLARHGRVLAATPRVRLPVLQAAGVQLDALIGSARDRAERYQPGDLSPAPRLYVATEAEQGGFTVPGGRFAALERRDPPVDAYGAGDSFAAGFTAALAAGWERPAALELACRCGSAALDGRGAYASQWRARRGQA